MDGDLMVGSRVGGYRIERLLGRGGMGAVYLAMDEALERHVALKLLEPALARDARFARRFLVESKLAARLDHPGIVPVYAAGETDGRLYIAMRYIRGGTLADRITSAGRMDSGDAILWLTTIASALDAAHDEGLVHRDVKPGNILLDAGRAMLCDFGLARSGTSADSLSREHGFSGTLAYVAPEIIEGGDVDGRADQYSLGCVLFETLTGMAPFVRDTEVAAIYAHVAEPPPSLAALRPDLAEAIDRVIGRALAKDRDQRYGSCAEMMRAAAEALGATTAGPALQASVLQTFLFCDIRGYTAYTRDHGDEAAAALAASFAGLVGELVSGFGGRLLELRGDEALLVFASPRQALRFGLALQREVSERGLERGVGIGLDAGEAVPVGDGYRGGALNRAARLCSLAGPGEVLASDAVVHLAGRVDGLVYGKRRVERLKGFDDPVGLVSVSAARAAPPPTQASPAPERSHRRAIALVAGLIVLVAAAIGVLATRGGGGNAKPVARSTFTPRLVTLDAATGRAGSATPGIAAWGFVTGADALYALDPNQQFLAVIDPASGRIGNRIPVERPHILLPTVEFGSIWYTTEDGDTVVRTDPTYGRTAARISLPHAGLDENEGIPPGGIARVGDEIWATYGFPARLARIDPAGNRVRSTARLPDGPPGTTQIVADGDQVWILHDDGSIVARLSRTGTVEATGKLAGGNIESAVAADGYLWVTTSAIDGLWKIGPEASPLTQIPTGRRTWQVVRGDGKLWVSNAGSGTVTAIDPTTGQTQQFTTGHRPLGIAVAAGRLWAGLDYSAAEARARITGMRVATVALADDSVTTDPAGMHDAQSFALGYAVSAGLMRIQPAADGTAAVVPDLAAAPPAVSADGRTYTFRIRAGRRFSPPSGAPITAEDVRFSLERVVAGDSYCSLVLASDIVGVKAFVDGQAPHVDGIAVHGDSVAITLTDASASLPARLTSPCAAVVPRGTPPAERGLLQPIPSGGPYYVDTHTVGEQIVLRPNPGYRGPRPARLDGIVLEATGDPEQGALLVEDGKADLAIDLGDAPSPAFAPGGRLEQRYGAGARCGATATPRPCFVRPLPAGVRWLQLNPASGALGDANARRAIAVGVDRTAIAATASGFPVTRIIGSGVPGYRPQALLPLAPDPSAAQALLGGEHPVIVLGIPRFRDDQMRVADAIRRELEPLGVHVDVRQFDDPSAEATRAKTRVNAVLGGWYPDYPDGENALYEVVSPTAPNYPFPPWLHSASVLRAVDAARGVIGTGRAAAWATADAAVVRDASFIPLYSLGGYPQLFSPRIACQIQLPLYGGLVDLAALCLR